MLADHDSRVERRSRARSTGRRKQDGNPARTVADLVAERLAESAASAKSLPGTSGQRTVAELAAERWPESAISAGAHRLRDGTSGTNDRRRRRGAPGAARARAADKARASGAQTRHGAAPRAVAPQLRPSRRSIPELRLWITGPGVATLVFAVVVVVAWLVGGSGPGDHPVTTAPKAASPPPHPVGPTGVFPDLPGQAIPGVRTGPVDCSRPGRILELSDWKLTLPVGANGKPTEILSARLGSYASTYFGVGRSCNAVRFRAPVNGVTTVDSQNPRSELREMVGGRAPAAWSSTSGTHTMTVTEAFTRLPEGNPQVVGGQIHDADDDISVFRLEGKNLYVTNGDDPHFRLVTSNYVLGTPFQARYVVGGGVIKAYVDGRLVATINRTFTGAYFKAGAYTQANCGDASPCDNDNYGEVLIYALKVIDSST